MDQNKTDETIDSIAEQLTQEIVADKGHDPSKSLLPPGVEKERIKGEVTTALKNHFISLSNGINSLLDRLETLSEEDNPQVDPQICEDIVNKLASASETNGQDGRVIDLNDDELKTCLKAAIAIYNQKDYRQAADAFYALTVLDPTRPLFWKCLGNAKFFNKNLKDAFDAYEMSLKINPHDPECLIYQARCLQIEGRETEAIDKLQHAAEIIGHDDNFAVWKDKVNAFIKDLKQGQ